MPTPAAIPPPPPGFGPVSTVPPPPPGFGPVSVAGSSSQPADQSSQGGGQGDLTQNPNGEGIYQMSGADGQTKGIPYSNVETAKQQGYKFAGDPKFNFAFMRNMTPEENRYNHDNAYDVAYGPGGAQMRQQLQQFASENNSMNPAIGAAKDLSGDAIGLDHLIRKVTGQGDKPLSAPERAVEDFSNEPMNGEQRAGAMGANVVEFMSGEELLKMLGKTPGALKLASQVEDLATKAPALAKTLQLGLEVAKRPELQQALVAGAQTYVRTGGDAGAAIQSAGWTGTAGALAGEVGAAAEPLLGKFAKTQEIAGVEHPAPAEPRPTAAQAAGQESIANTSRSVLERNLQELNESRVPENGPKALPAQTGPYQFQLKGNPATETREGASVVPARPMPREGMSGSVADPTGSGQRIPARLSTRKAFMTSADLDTAPERGSTGADISTGRPIATETTRTTGPGVLTTEDPAVARAHLQATNKIVDSPQFQRQAAANPAWAKQVMEAKADTERQLDEYWQQQAGSKPGAGMPGMQQVNIPELTRSVGSHTEAAEAMRKVISQGYDELADRAGLQGQSTQTYTTLKNAYQNAEDAVRGASTQTELAAAEAKSEEAHQNLTRFFDQIGVTPKEVSGLNEGYKNYLVMRDAAKAVDGSFDANPYLAKSSGSYRGFDGNALKANIRSLVDKYGYPEVTRVMGRDNLANLDKIADLNRTIAGRQNFGVAVSQIGKSLMQQATAHLGTAAIAGGELAHVMGGRWGLGALAGGGAYAATRAVYHAITTNPKVAQNIIFALESGARVERYSPFIASMIANDATDRARQQQQQQQQQEEGGQQ